MSFFQKAHGGNTTVCRGDSFGRDWPLRLLPHQMSSPQNTMYQGRVLYHITGGDPGGGPGGGDPQTSERGKKRHLRARKKAAF